MMTSSVSNLSHRLSILRLLHVKRNYVTKTMSQLSLLTQSCPVARHPGILIQISRLSNPNKVVERLERKGKRREESPQDLMKGDYWVQLAFHYLSIT
jgi:hypothetical protein